MSVLRFSDVFKEEDWKSNSQELKELETHGICIYTDGGWRAKETSPNCSWGIHSYFYKEGKPDKASQRYKLNFPTKQGYTDLPSQKADIVTSLKVFNASGLIYGQHTTNNIAELQAFILALDLVLKTDLKDILKTVRIFSDSEYVLKGTNTGLPVWSSNGWKNSQGAPVKNIEYWQVIASQVKELEALDLDIDFHWRKGHEDFGNLTVDSFCTLAIKSKIEISNFKDESWYFSKEVDLEPLMTEQRYLHFPGLTERYENYTYMFSFLDTKLLISQLGCRLEDLSISVLSIANEGMQNKLKLIQDECLKLEENITPVPMVVEVKNFLANNFDSYISNDLIAKLPRIEEIDKIIINNPTNDNPVVSIISPPRNSFKLLLEYQKAVDILDEYDESICYTDITDMVYKFNDKKKELDFLLKTEQAIDVKVNYWDPIDLKIRRAEVTLTIGLDLPRRRLLATIASLKPKISVVTWDRGNYSFKFGVVVETEDSYGIFLSPYTNNQLTK